VKQVVSSQGIDRLILFLKTLDAFANTKEYDLLSMLGYENSVDLADAERINTVMNFVMTNYSEEIKISTIAKLINLTEASFCRYFKSKTHKTFSQFLNEVRILNACKLLVDSNMTITQICYNAGYNNISHFNRQFKLITGLTAKEYSKKYLNESF
jgi:YesN/AraC family two-component response regulator